MFRHALAALALFSLLAAELCGQIQQAQKLLSEGKYTEAAQHFARLREDPAFTGRDRAAVEANFAIALLQSGQLDAAEASFSEAHRLLSAAPTPVAADDPLWLALWNAEALLARQRGRWQQARQIHNRVEQLTRLGDPVTHGVSLANRAELERAFGEPATAEAYARRALAVLDLPQPSAARPRLAALHILGLAVQAQGRNDEAIATLTQVWQARQQLDGAASRGAAVSAAALGAAYLGSGRYAVARERLQTALPLLEQHLGPHHPEVAAVWNNLAQAAKLQGRYAEADPLYRRALAIWERTYGKASLEYGSGLANFGNFFLLQGKTSGAARLYAEAEHILSGVLGVADPRTQAARLRRLEAEAKSLEVTQVHALRYQPTVR